MVNVLAGIIGALLGLSGALLGAWIKSRGEQRRWLHDQKLAGAAEMVSAGTTIYELRSGSREWVEGHEPVELREWQTQLQRGRAVIHLLCTQETRDRATAFVRLCWRAGSPGEEHDDQTIAALRSFTDSLRKELGSD